MLQLAKDINFLAVYFSTLSSTLVVHRVLGLLSVLIILVITTHHNLLGVLLLLLNCVNLVVIDKECGIDQILFPDVVSPKLLI